MEAACKHVETQEDVLSVAVVLVTHWSRMVKAAKTSTSVGRARLAVPTVAATAEARSPVCATQGTS